MHETSTFGLNLWYNNIFEKFGWMTLAHRDGDEKHIVYYCHSIELLCNHIEDKIKHLKKLNKKEKNIIIIDKIEDLNIMKNNLLTLHINASKLCKSNNK